MIHALILASLLSIQDPSNDAVGAGNLVPPSSEDFITGTLDVTEFTILDQPQLSIQLKFASLANPFDRVLGFSFPIIEIYIQDNDASSGATISLEGSSMLFANGSFWTYALRLSGDKAELFEWTAEGLKSLEPVSVFTQDNSLSVRTPISPPRNFTTYGIVGYYTPFNQTGWQDISSNPSPWAYSSLEQKSPVIDVITENPDVQTQAIRQNVLPPIASSSPPNYWVYVMIMGLCLAIFGFIIRTRSRSQSKAALEPKETENPPILQRSAAEVAAFEAFLRLPNTPNPSQTGTSSNNKSVETEQEEAGLEDNTDLQSSTGREDDSATQDDNPEDRRSLAADPKPGSGLYSAHVVQQTQALPESPEQEIKTPLNASEITLVSPEKPKPDANSFLDDISASTSSATPSQVINKQVVTFKPEVADLGEFPDNEIWDNEDESVWQKPNKSET